MNFPTLLAFLMARANAVASPGDPPTGPPTNVTRELYAGTKIRVLWTKGDATATSKVYRRVSGNWVFLGSVAAGIEQFETGLTSGTFGVSHFKNGQETTIVSEA